MNYCLNKKINNQKGFTLLELMIVVGIMVLLAASALVVFNPAEKQKEQKDALRVSALSQIASAMELFYAENKKYPVNLNELSAYNLKVSLADPSGNAGCDYQYYTDTLNTYYEIYSIKESINFGVPKGQDFIKEIPSTEMNVSLNFTGCPLVPQTDPKVFKVSGGTPQTTP